MNNENYTCPACGAALQLVESLLVTPPTPTPTSTPDTTAPATAGAPVSTDTSTDTDTAPAPQQGDACTMPDGVTAGTLQPGGDGLVCVAN